jgi:hypothetical protein
MLNKAGEVSWSKEYTPASVSKDYRKPLVPFGSLYIPWRIHGAATYGNMDPINIPQSC